MRRAHPKDLSSIRSLLATTGMSVDSYHINHRDISVVAEDQGKVVGFLWVGLMGKNAVGYIDKFVVDPAYSGKGVGNALAMFALAEAKKRGVKEVHGFIRQAESHPKSGMNALKVALSADAKSYTYVRGQLDFMISEINSLKKESA